MELLSIIPVVAAIVQIIILVVFFVMAKNVSEIKKNINRKPSIKEYLDMAGEEKYVGNKEKAKEYFLRAKYHTEKLGIQTYIPEFSTYANQIINKIEKEISEL